MQGVTIQQLLADHPEAVGLIDHDKDSSIWRGRESSEESMCNTIRLVCSARKIGSPLDSVESLLTAIDAKLKAERGLSDAEIEGMKWVVAGDVSIVLTWCGNEFTCFAKDNDSRRRLFTSHEECIERLWREVLRLRARCGEAADAK